MAASMKFEKALEKLEILVDELESGDVPLEDALKKYEEGIKLATACQAQLTSAEQKIKLLSQNTDGSFKESNFETEDEDES